MLSIKILKKQQAKYINQLKSNSISRSKKKFLYDKLDEIDDKIKEQMDPVTI